jgi:hypothetical protein
MDRIMMNREIVLNGRWRLDAVNNQLVDLQGGAAATALSPVAVRLLTLFAESPNTVIGRRRLFAEGWRQFGFEVCDNSLNQVICVLRAYSTQIEQPFHGKANADSTAKRTAIPCHREQTGCSDAGVLPFYSECDFAVN